MSISWVGNWCASDIGSSVSLFPPIALDREADFPLRKAIVILIPRFNGVKHFNAI